jgi:hypothetical protein
MLAIAAGGLLAAALLVAGNAAAAPENVCQARCYPLNPGQFPKEDRWKALPRYEQCLATCRRSG